MCKKQRNKKRKIKGGGIKSASFKFLTNSYRKSAKFFGNRRPIRLLEDGEYHFGLHNFTGPGTKIRLEKVRNFQPYNNIDACSRKHDIEYAEAYNLPEGSPERLSLIRKADRKALECYNKFPNENGYYPARAGINSKMKFEDLSPELAKMMWGVAYHGSEEKKSDDRLSSGKQVATFMAKQTHSVFRKNLLAGVF